MTLDSASIAWLHLDSNGWVVRSDDAVERILGVRPRPGELLDLPFLAPYLTTHQPGSVHLRHIRLDDDALFDAVGRRDAQGWTWCFIDRRSDAPERFSRQQQELQADLRRESEEAVLRAALYRMDVAVFWRTPAGTFRFVGPVQPWLNPWLDGPATHEVDLAGRSDFLGPLLELFEAKALGEEFESLPFQEGPHPPLQAYLSRSTDGSTILMMRPSQAEGQRWLQDARVLSLEHASLLEWVQERDVLLHCIVHDLAGPLTTLTSVLCALQSEALPWTEMKPLVSVALEQADRQNEMIQDILNAFRPEASGPKTLLELGPIATEVIAAVQAAHPGQHFELDTAAAPVRGEPDRLRRVVHNLVENACRHAGRQGRIRVELSRNDERVRVSVHDSGPGVAASVRPFERLAQGPNPGRIGLGLYFCRITVERHGGHIGHAPSPLGGAEFWFELPISGLA